MFGKLPITHVHTLKAAITKCAEVCIYVDTHCPAVNCAMTQTHLQNKKAIHQVDVFVAVLHEY